MARVKGKVALVTGAASGIGRSIAELLAKEGAEVIVTDLNEVTGREVTKKINAEGGRAFFQVLNVTDESAWVLASAAITERYGRLDVLVNNAHNLTSFRNVPHHWHKAFVLVVGPPCIRFMGNNFSGINVQPHLFAAV